MVICDSDRMACARLIAGGGRLAKEAIGEKTGLARDRGKGDRMDDMDMVESERSGAPKRNGGRDVVASEAQEDPRESDRRGTALLRLGNARTDKPPLSFRMEEDADEA